MARKLVAPVGATSTSHQGEEYLVDATGHVTVPDELAKILQASHGFRPEGSARQERDTSQRSRQVQVGQTAHLTIADDDEVITDDEAPPLQSYPSPQEFSAGLTQARMKQYLKHEGVAIPRTGTVRDLRRLVEETYTAALDAYHGGTRRDAPSPPTEDGTGAGGDQGGTASGDQGGTGASAPGADASGNSGETKQPGTSAA